MYCHVCLLCNKMIGSHADDDDDDDDDDDIILLSEIKDEAQSQLSLASNALADNAAETQMPSERATLQPETRTVISTGHVIPCTCRSLSNGGLYDQRQTAATRARGGF